MLDPVIFSIGELYQPGAIRSSYEPALGHPPDQPRVPGTGVSYTRIANVLMILAGALLLLIKYEVLRLPLLSPGALSYAIGKAEPPEAEAPGTQE